MVNTDWAKEHHDALQGYVNAYLRGVRDYCNAYHHGPVRKDMIDSDGVVRNVWHKVKVPGHVAEVLKAAKAL